jgi:hypothetical protein
LVANKLNWQKGLFRLWIFISSCYILFSFCLLYFNINDYLYYINRETYIKDYLKQNDDYKQRNIIIFKKEISDLLPYEDKREGLFDEFLVDDYGEKALNNVLQKKRNLQTRIFLFVALMLMIPAIIFFIGRITTWIIRGFVSPQ